MNVIDYIREHIDNQLTINSYIKNYSDLDEDVIREFRERIDWSDFDLLKAFNLHSKSLRDEFKEFLRPLIEAEEKMWKRRLEFNCELIESILEDFEE